MKVALTVWEGRISPLFDVTRMLLIADIESHRVSEKHFEPFDFDSAFFRAEKLHDLGVKVLICGGISGFFDSFIEAKGIQIIPFAAGAVNEVLEAYVNGNLFTERFRMPGCKLSNDTQVSEED
jgi:predicted Fe-Mo cluster-binding NifX family protein